MKKASTNQRANRKRRLRKRPLHDCCEVFKAAGVFLKSLASLVGALTAFLIALAQFRLF